MNAFDYGHSPGQPLSRATIGTTANGWTLRGHSRHKNVKLGPLYLLLTRKFLPILGALCFSRVLCVFVYFVDRFVQVLKVRSTKYTNHTKQMQPLRRRKVRRRCVQKIYLSFHLVIDSITSQPLRSRDTISPVPGCRKTFLFQFLDPPREKTAIRFLHRQGECLLIRSTSLFNAP